MARRVFLHIGLPKTATTYLQTILWSNRQVLEEQGIRLPGIDRRDHLWSTRIIRREEHFARVSAPHRLKAWQRVCRDVAAWSETAVISHEFFAAASPDEAARVLGDLAPAEVHLVVTAREPLGLFTASWQESIKNRDTTPMADYSRTESEDSGEVWNWRTLDVRLVLERWSPQLSPERVHVLPLPGPDAPKQVIWDRFARLVGADPESVDLSSTFANTSMGVVEAETLRRMNAHLGGFSSAIDRGTFIRSFVADERLVPRGGDRFWPSADRVAEIRDRGERAADYLGQAGFDVIGDLDALRVPAVLPERRVPESVTDAEVAEVAVWLAARLLYDVRDLRHERRDLREQVDRPSLRLAVATRFPWTRRFVLRDRPDRPGRP